MFTPLMKVAASEKGGLEKFQATCNCCGMVVRSSQLTLAEQDVAAHRAYHEKKNS